MTKDVMVTHNQLFPNEEQSNVSHEFTVYRDPVAVRAFGLIENQRVRIEQGARLPCGNMVWGPLRICCPVELHTMLTQVVLGTTGLYRAYILDPDELGIDDITVVQHRAEVYKPTTRCCEGE